MSLPDTPFISGTTPVKPYPLARFLPPYLEGSASAWLREVLPLQPGQADPPWVIDPFGASPCVDIEAARSGYRILVAANNPIARFLLEMTAHPPSEAELQAVLAELAASSKGGERMEPHIRSLYTTTCGQCAQTVMVEAFLWEKGATTPFARIYSCSNCGSNGEFPATTADAEKAHHFASGGLHRARALERIAPADDPDRIHAEEALSVYLPRAVYALFTLINKLDGLNLPHVRRNMLAALLLAACDQANTLWQYPPRRERPRQLTIPPKFRENNIWLALEHSLSLWATGQPPVPLTLWPELPPPVVASVSSKAACATWKALPHIPRICRSTSARYWLCCRARTRLSGRCLPYGPAGCGEANPLGLSKASCAAAAMIGPGTPPG